MVDLCLCLFRHDNEGFSGSGEGDRKAADSAIPIPIPVASGNGNGSNGGQMEMSRLPQQSVIPANKRNVVPPQRKSPLGLKMLPATSHPAVLIDAGFKKYGTFPVLTNLNMTIKEGTM